MLQSTAKNSKSQASQRFNRDDGRLDTNTKSVRAKKKFRSEIFKMRRYSGSLIVTEKDYHRGYSRTKYCGCAIKNKDIDPSPLNKSQCVHTWDFGYKDFEF